MTIGIIGGILLVIGAWYVSQGRIFRSVLVYFVADVCWVVLAYESGDMVGTILISVGMLLGLLAFYKMNKGELNKTLLKKDINNG